MTSEKRWPSAVAVFLITNTLVVSWLGMQWVHEFGHVLGGWVTGGTIAKIVLHPLTISRTDLAVNPQPLLVTWAGPFLGVILPTIVWLGAARWKLESAYLFRFFAGFCCVANGLYLGCGSFYDIGDCGDLIRLGAPRWSLWWFGGITCILGFRLWSGQGVHFGLGTGKLPSWKHTLGMFLCGIALVLIGVICFPES